MTAIELQTDPERVGRCHGVTGIYIRARAGDGKYGSYDIAELHRDSLIAWLFNEPARAAQVVLISLEHAQIADAAPVHRMKHEQDQ